MVFTGSIGLHNVLTGLKRAGYANDPTNDMQTIDVPALAEEDAVSLARRLLEGEGIATQDIDITSRAVASSVDCLPFFIHHIVDQLAKEGGTASAARVVDIVDQNLTAPQDPWHLRYYHERIDTYYLADERPIALALLDALALADAPLSFKEVEERIASEPAAGDKDRVRQVLTLVQRDHYVVQERDGHYRFRFPIIRRHWRLYRGL